SALQVGESAQATLAFCEVTHSYGFGIISSEGNLRILHSTIRHNRSTAIRSNGASAELRIDNSTIHSNERTGVSIESSAWISNSTIAGNSLGGISCEYSDNVNLHNSVVASNVSWGSAPQEIVGQIHAAGFNAIGDPATSGGIVDGEN